LTIRPILRLRRQPSFNRSVEAVEKRLALEGRAINIRFLPELSAGSRKLYSHRPYGQPVYAATFIRKRQIVLDQALEHDSRELTRILIHELFHFVWVRLSNRHRKSFSVLLARELSEHARGELGWSAEMRKSRLPRTPQSAQHERGRWRDYVCESFCDTAAWFYSEIGRHKEFTLATRHRKRRGDWFRVTFSGGRIPI